MKDSLLSRMLFDILHIVRRRLVHVVIQPIGIEQIRAGSPPHDRLAGGVIVGEIVGGRLDGQSCVLVAEVLILQGVRVVLGVTHDEDLLAAGGHGAEHACLLRAGQDADLLHGLDILPLGGGVAGVGDVEHVVVAAEQHGAVVVQGMLVHAEELLLQGVLLDAVVVVEACLGAPADMQGGGDMGLAPLHDLAQLGPVVHLLEGDLLHGGSRDDHTVVLLVLDLVEGLVEGQHMLLGGVAGLMGGGLEQLQLHLEGGVADEARDLGLGLDLLGHEIEHENVEGTDVLGDGAGLGHHEDVFLEQRIGCGEKIGNFNGHGDSPFRGIILGKGLIFYCLY